MSSPPTGTVTFLFTDIEGSTKLAQEHRDVWESLRTRHHAILHHAMQAHDGHVFQIVGDEFCVAFHTAIDAVRAAADAQRTLFAEPWEPVPIKVRMGIHSGTARIGDIVDQSGDYTGYIALARVSRLMSAGHGGQVLVSLATEELVRDELPKQVSLRDMGTRRLKDLIHPEQIFQLIIPGLPTDFPPLKTLDTYRHNLPIQLTTFIGREKELTEIRQAIMEHRLVTLTGAGGTGKTRLSLHVAADLLDSFPDGAWFVELASLTNPELIPQTVLSSFGIGDQPGLTSLQLLTDYVHARKLLLVLDNCEHLITEVAQLVTTLLTSAEDLKILATSRESLGVSGELNWYVPSLSLPDIKRLPPMEGLSQYEAVRLFIERAILAQPHFTVTRDNAPGIAQICYRLDGIPLAIELAAARVKVLDVEQIARRLDDRFSLLTGGARTSLPRHQTLRATLDWSYDLLSDQEKVLFHRLAVFVGGWTLEAAEQVCVIEEDGLDVLGLLAHLVEKSLVVMDNSAGEARYHMLETTRQYARERLSSSREVEVLRKRHLEYYLSLAEQSLGETIGSIQRDWLPHMAKENDNLRAVLGWCLDSDNVQTGLRLAVRLGYFWLQAGDLREGQNWLERYLARVPQSIPERAGGLQYLALYMYNMGDYASALPLVEESRALFETLGELSGVADTTFRLAWLQFALGNYAQSRHLLERSLKLYQRLDKPADVAYVIEWMGDLACAEGDFVHARELLERSAALQRRQEDRIRLFYVLSDLGRVLIHFGELDRSEALFKETMSIQETISIQLKLRRDSNFTLILFMDFAFLANARGQPLRAIRLLGACEAGRKITGYHIEGPERPDYESNLASLHAQLDPVTFESAWAEGAALTLEQAVNLAVQEE